MIHLLLFLMFAMILIGYMVEGRWSTVAISCALFLIGYLARFVQDSYTKEKEEDP